MLKANYSKLNYKQSLGGGGGEIKPWPQRSCPCNKEDMHSHIRKDPTNNPTLKHPTQHPKKHPLLAFLSNKLTTWHWLSQKNQNMLWLLMACINKSQHNFKLIFLLNIYAKTILPIYLVPHLKIFPMKNNIFIWEIKEAGKIERLKKF